MLLEYLSYRIFVICILCPFDVLFVVVLSASRGLASNKCSKFKNIYHMVIIDLFQILM